MVRIRNMEEFATLSGVSRPTVSKYFHDPSSVRPKIRAQIERALEQYDYQPNIFAINQNRKLTKNIGIVVPYLADPFFAEIARNLEQRCLAAGFQPTLYSSHGQPDLEVGILSNLRRLKPAGVLLAPLGRVSNRAEIEKFCKDVPTVLFDSALDDVGLAFIGSDNPNLALQIVDYLCRSGEPPCFMEMKTPANPNANKRREAYLQAMAHFGQTPQIVKIEGIGWAFEEIGYTYGGAALASNAFATNTILCSNDRLAIGLLSACYEQQIRVGMTPGCAIRVAGQDDHPFSRFTCPPLTTVAQDYESISAKSLEILMQVIDGGAVDAAKTLFEGRLVMRQSA
ncbi:LacI family DNA-binding transcriptional regulator [uncultured Roseobacter sp.]|uniref:LacI family DNA-binding transcriptional regulator n=1 Tax=uncultured Roseobacter sp. TaxID=114847 RepID=UPI00262E722B|nr:LacI family DNA-binding transcriptional regulator [uncultured Roseobacter sp.]